MATISADLIYFSPTGSTQKYVKTFAQSLKLQAVTEWDLTTPDGRSMLPAEVTSDIVVIGFPVYEEYVPELFLDALNRFRFHHQPAVGIAVYGKVGFGMGLVQMFRFMTDKGLKPVSMGAFIGEHSFARKSNPLALGRPGSKDLGDMRVLAESFNEVTSAGPITIRENQVPGSLPLMARVLPKRSASFFTRPPEINENCNRCMLCVLQCPVGAIGDDLKISEEKCLRCFACVKKCVRSGRAIEYRMAPLVKMVFRLHESRLKRNILITAI